MAGLTTEARRAVLQHLVEHTAADRAAQCAGFTQCQYIGGAEFLCGDPPFDFQTWRHRQFRAGWFAAQPIQQGRHFGERGHVIHAIALQRPARHVRPLRVVRVLHDAGPAASLDGLQAGRTIVQQTGQHHADYPRAVGNGSRTEQRVDRGSSSVLLRTTAQQHMAVLQQKVEIRRRDDDLARSDRLAVHRMLRWQRTRFAQQIGQDTFRCGADVLNDEH